MLLANAFSRDVVKSSGHPVRYFVDRPPRNTFHIKRVGVQNSIGTADDFEGIGVYFMSDASRYHTGDLVKIDGGWMANAGKLNTSAERRA